MTSICLWKGYQIPTSLKHFGNSPKRKSYGMIHKTSHQLNWISTCSNLILQKTLFQSKTTWVGGAMSSKLQILPLHKKIIACHNYFLQKKETIWTDTTNSSLNSQSDSREDGSRQTPSHMTKTFCDTLSDYLPESSQTKNSTRTRIKSLRETDSWNNLFRTRQQNPTRSRFLPPLQKQSSNPWIRGRRDNSQNTKNYRSNKAFRLKKTTTSQRFPITIAEFSWPYPRNLQIKRSILWH